MKPTPEKVEDVRWNLMFRDLKSVISVPSEDHPAARVWRRSDLVAVIAKVRDERLEQLKSTFPSANAVIERMLQIGWLQKLPVQNGVGERTLPEIYLLDMEATEEDLPEFWELLQGYQTTGVLCYFGALSFHELTTQVPAFFHIATLLSPTPRTSVIAANPGGDVGEKPGRIRDPLGTLIFRYQGRPCYATRRDSSLVPGIQLREYGPRTQLRITTLEQTMLDTLWHPLRCGGESVVFEAWERGVGRWNPERMAKHLSTINRQDLDRRVGAIMTLIKCEIPSGTLKTLLEARQTELRKVPSTEPLPLLPGLPGSTLLSGWGILTP